MLLSSGRSVLPSGTSCMQTSQSAPSWSCCSRSPLAMHRRIAKPSRPAASTPMSRGKSKHHVISSTQIAPCFPHTIPYQYPFSSRMSPFQTPFSSASHGRFQSVVSHAFGVDDSGTGEAHNQRGRGGQNSGWEGGRTGRGGRGRGELRNSQDPGRSSSRGGRRGGRASRGRGGFPDVGKTPEEQVPTLQVCIQDAANAAHLPPNPMACCMYSLAKRVCMDTQGGAQYSSNECADVVDAARKMIRQLLGSSSSSGAPASTSQQPAMQLDSKHLSLLAWSLSVMVGSDESLRSDARQLCYVLAERAAQPRVIGSRADVACRNWAGVLYGLAKSGVKCSDNACVEQVFQFCMEQELPALLFEGQKCLPQSVSNVAMACVDAGYEGSMEPFISAVARRVVEPSMGGVRGGLMASAAPQNWSNLLYACAKLKQRSGKVEADGGLGGGMTIIAEEGAIAMADALRKPVRYQPNSQDLENTLWALSYLKWFDASITRVLAHAMVECIGSSTSQGISNTLLALARFEWYDEGVVSKLAAGMVERIDSSTSQGISNTLWALSTLGWYEPSVYDALLVALLDKSVQCDPQELKDAIYSCAPASHGGSAVDELAHLISKQDVRKEWAWIDQNLANALYAWAVMGSIGIASDSLSAMAQHLMHEVNERGPAAFQTSEITQLYLAHLEAERVGLQGGGLSTGNGMLQVAAEQHVVRQVELREKARQSGGTAGVRQAAAVLRDAGYEVDVGGRVGMQGEFHADLLVRHESCPRGIAVDVLSGTDQFRYPRGQLSGKARLKHVQIRHRCDGLVVLSEAAAKQPGLVVQSLEQECMGAAAQTS